MMEKQVEGGLKHGVKSGSVVIWTEGPKLSMAFRGTVALVDLSF